MRTRAWLLMAALLIAPALPVFSPKSDVKVGWPCGDGGPDGSALREDVNRVLLEILENGTYDKLNRKWFADRP